MLFNAYNAEQYSKIPNILQTIWKPNKTWYFNQANLFLYSKFDIQINYISILVLGFGSGYP